MAEKLKIAIVGLGLVGASAGMALRRYPDKVRVIGHDRDPGVAGKAKSMGAVEKTEWNLINAVSGADRILLALPVAEVKETLKAVGQDLKPGCVILNMSTVNAAAQAWAAEYLPDNVALVGGFPVQIAENLDTGRARADLFEGKLFCLTPDTRVSDVGANLASDLVEALGAHPFFLDPVEYDGLVAAVEQLPLVTAGALLQITTDNETWQDMRKLAGSQYYSATLIMNEDPAMAAGACIANRDNLVRWIDELTATLGEWRQALIDGNEESLTTIFEQGMNARFRWLQAQSSGNWTEETGPELPTSGNYLRGLIGLRGPDRTAKKGR